MCVRARNGMRYDRLWLVRKHDFDEKSDQPTKRNVQLSAISIARDTMPYWSAATNWITQGKTI